MLKENVGTVYKDGVFNMEKEDRCRNVLGSRREGGVWDRFQVSKGFGLIG